MDCYLKQKKHQPKKIWPHYIGTCRPIYILGYVHKNIHHTHTRTKPEPNICPKTLHNSLWTAGLAGYVSFSMRQPDAHVHTTPNTFVHSHIVYFSCHVRAWTSKYTPTRILKPFSGWLFNRLAYARTNCVLQEKSI